MLVTTIQDNNEPILQASTKLQKTLQQAMLAGAIGDAFGLPLEFLSEHTIKHSGFHLKSSAGQLTFCGKSSDDTQLNLFTAEAIIRFKSNYKSQDFSDYRRLNDSVVVEVARAYQRWLYTQGEVSIFCENLDTQAGLVACPELNQRVEPGNTCITALKDMQYPSDVSCNFSLGSGVTIKNLPLAMLYAGDSTVKPSLSCYQTALACFDLGFKVAQITHGHPIAKLIAAVITTILFFNLERGPGKTTLAYSIAMTRELIISNQASILSSAVDIDKSVINHIVDLLNKNNYKSNTKVSAYGQGWCADETLAIALHCALQAESFEQLLVMSACHTGDSDSTCSLAALIFVSARGGEDMPNYLLENLELRNIVKEISAQLIC